MTNDSIDVVVARSHEEVDQPSLSARALEPLTRSFLIEAGVRAGMRVLDVCSGAGDLTFLLTELVGPKGHVTGLDQTRETTAYASERAAFRGLDNVEFVEAPLEELPFLKEFDAIVGRAVLMYRSDPSADLQRLARCLRPGGLVAFQELDLLAGKTTPPSPLIDQVYKWLIEIFRRAGIATQMGPELYQTFVAAGLPPPRMHLDGFIGGHESISPALMANVVRMLTPQIEHFNLATAGELQIDTLEQRMRDDLVRSGGVMSTPLLIGAWTRPLG